jgi:hypothetical protein
VCVLAAAALARAEAPPPAADAGGAGLRVYRDPATGEFTEPPADEAASALGGAATAARRLPALRQRPSPVAGGGVIVDLGERFQSVVRARIDGAAPQVSCDAAGAASSSEPTR